MLGVQQFDQARNALDFFLVSPLVVGAEGQSEGNQDHDYRCSHIFIILVESGGEKCDRGDMRPPSLLLLSALMTGCVHWPGAPYTDKVLSLPDGELESFSKVHPDAVIVPPIYRYNTDRYWGYRPVSYHFMFTENNVRMKALVRVSGVLEVRRIVVLEKVPPHITDHLKNSDLHVIQIRRLELLSNPADVIYEYDWSDGRSGTGFCILYPGEGTEIRGTAIYMVRNDSAP